MNVRFIVELTDAERGTLRELLAGGKEGARKLKRAQILLAADERMADEVIAKAVCCGTSTIYRIKRRFVEEGLDVALVDRPRPGGERKLTSHQEALLVAVACSSFSAAGTAPDAAACSAGSTRSGPTTAP